VEDGVLSFNIDDFRGSSVDASRQDRLTRQYARIVDSGKHITQIKQAVDAALKNIQEHKASSFVIYGEPQSGKTEMMIALTAALLDSGLKMIVILTNDSVQLLEQNLQRFQTSALDPAPKNFLDVLDSTIQLRDREWVIFAKKNQSDLTRLYDRIRRVSDRIVIDDEADFASPNSKVNRAEKTRINELVEQLIGKEGLYIGVTATPARLDLNATFDNDNGKWVDFPPHDKYTGQDIFFPTTSEALENLEYKLVLMKSRNDAKSLRKAMLSFMVNVAYLNLNNVRPGNYSMLIHTSGKTADHTTDYEAVTKVLNVLADDSRADFERYVKELYEVARERYEGLAADLTRHVLRHINQNNVVIMNSRASRAVAGYQRATDPATLFTFVVGGNIVSRGVTFNNLLSMYFTRDSMHRIQQDTYIQRARMFGNRGSYLRWFELHIPEDLYFVWQRCFVFHKLSLRGIREQTAAPLWLEDSRVKPASAASVKQSAVQWQSGEMFWEMFDLTDEILDAVGAGGAGMEALEQLAQTMKGDFLPEHLLDFIRNFQPHGGESVALHPVTVLSDKYQSADVEQITRERGFIGTPQLERSKYPRAIHHIKIFGNSAGKARVYYKYSPSANDVRVNSRRLSFVARERQP
jgi:Z1 domain/Type III restriction enzyme, res subunit